MRALILAAGLGTRLRPLTETVPKCLAPIRRKPLLDYWLDLLLGGGHVERVLVNTSHLADRVRRHVAESPWRSRVDLIYEEVLLGTGGTVLANRGWLGGAAFMVAHGDNLTDFDPAAFIARHAQRPPGTEITMMTFVTDTPSSCGIVEMDRSGRVVAMHEKSPDPPGDVANAAVYIFEPAVIDFMAGLGRPVIDLSTEVLPEFMGRIYTYANTRYHRDIGTPESLAQANADFSPR